MPKPISERAQRAFADIVRLTRAARQAVREEAGELRGSWAYAEQTLDGVIGVTVGVYGPGVDVSGPDPVESDGVRLIEAAIELVAEVPELEQPSTLVPVLTSAQEFVLAARRGHVDG